MATTHSRELFARANKVTPGGVNSPVRAFGSVGGEPVFIARAKGSTLWDEDGNAYVDFVGSWGPLILGHAPDAVLSAIAEALPQGTSFGASTCREVELAERVVGAVPSVESVRFVNSGTEATMSAIRLARGFTRRNRILKFSGCYHGHGDAFLSEAGSGVATLGIPGSAGVPQSVARDTITLPFNDEQTVAAAFREHGDSLAAVILEPVPCNMGLVLPTQGFLQALRTACDKHGALLIFDEVITGFRLGLGGAQAYFDIRPDLSTFGKIIGGGLPVGAYGGRGDVMNQVAPVGPVYQAGTLSGNPLAMAAGIATLDALSTPFFYDKLEETAATFETGMRELLNECEQPAHLSRIGSIFHLWFKPGANSTPRDYEQVREANSDAFSAFFSSMLHQGIYLAPSAFEVGFVSAAHTREDIEQTLKAAKNAFASL